MILVEVCSNAVSWDDTVLECDGHPLQMWGWGEVKSRYKWRASRLLVKDGGVTIGGAQVLTRRLPWPFKSLHYIPRGPFAEKDREVDVLNEITGYLRVHMGGTLITVEPDSENLPECPGWIKSTNTILIPETLTLDLTKSTDELQSDMSKKTRQYIRKSANEDGMTIRRVRQRDEIAKCLDIYRQTAQRAGFPLHGDDYYYNIHELMGDSSIIFAAFHNDQPVAFVWMVISGSVSFELYGGMNDEGQKLRANYALKWHAITKCKEWGIDRYDMNGLLNDGVSTFKRGFASHENLLAGTYDYPISGFLYTVWSRGLPMTKKTIRKIKSLRK